MKTVLKAIIMLMGMLASMTVATFSSAYMLTGFDKAKYIDLLNKIPADRFGFILVPTLLISFGVACFFWYKLMKTLSYSPPPGNVHLKGLIDEHLRNNALHVKK